MAERWAVIADDLTGALDTALQFRKAGRQTFVSTRARRLAVAQRGSCREHREPARFGLGSHRACPSRIPHLAGRAAASRLQENRLVAARKHRRGSCGRCARPPAAPPLVFAPAFPAGGRTTIDGVHRLNGVPAAETAPGSDPLSPVRESHIPTLLRDSAQLNAESVPLATVRGGRDGLVAALARASRSGVDILAPDVETDDDLREVASALLQTANARISAGSAGLAEYLARPQARVTQGLDPLGDRHS